MQTVQIPKPSKPAAGFNPFGLTAEHVREDVGWRLLNEGDVIQVGDGFWHPDYEAWIDYRSRPAIFDAPHARVHTWPWRRKTK